MRVFLIFHFHCIGTCIIVYYIFLLNNKLNISFTKIDGLDDIENVALESRSNSNISYLMIRT